MQLVKVIKKTNSKIEQAKMIISIFSLLSDIRLSETQLTVLAYYMVYGINSETEKLIINSQILIKSSLKNTNTVLKRFGLIKKHALTKSYFVNETLNLKLDTEIGMLIKIDNK